MDEHNTPAPADGGLPVTLASVVESLGPDCVEVRVAPRGLEVAVSALAVREGDEDPPAGADLLLGIGAGGDPAALVDAAGRAGAAAVVVRSHSAAGPGLADRARERGVAVLALADGQDWAELIGRLRALLAVSATPRPGHAGPLGRRHDLVNLANTLADLVRGSVMVFTPGQELMAASRLGPGDDEMRRAAVLDQHGPPGYRTRLAQLGVYRRLWSGEGVVDVAAVPELDAGRRLAVAVRAGTENLGSIWVAEGTGPLADNAAALLAEAAPAAASLLLGLDQEELARRRLTEEIVGRALLGEIDPRSAAVHLGVAPETPAAVLIADFSAAGPGTAAPGEGQAQHVPVPGVPNAAVLHRVREESLRHLAGYRWRAVATTGPSRVVLVLLHATDPGGVRRAAQGAAAAVTDAVGLRPRIGIGPCVPHLGELSASCAEAELAVRALARRGEHGCARFDDVRGTASLLVLGEAVTSDARLQAGPVARLREHDRRRGTDYTATLAAYLDAFGDTATASRALNVHANTLRYRLRRAAELTGLDLSDPHERLSVGVQLFTLGHDGPGTGGGAEPDGTPVGTTRGAPEPEVTPEGLEPGTSNHR